MFPLGVLCQKKVAVDHTKILLPLNYNTTFADLTGNAVVAKYGVPLLGNGDGYGHSKWSNGSLATNLTAGAYLTIESTPLLDLSGRKPFTIECWVFANPYGGGSAIFSMRSGSEICPIVMNFGHTKIGDSALASWQNDLVIQPSNETWEHVAIVGDGTNITIYRGGTSIAQVAHPDWPVGDRFLNIGHDSEAHSGCYFNDFRFSDIARYTANFTPPTSAFTFGKPIERWFRFDDNLSNSGDLATTATLDFGSVTYSNTITNYAPSTSDGKSLLANGTQIITLSPTVTLGADFYVQFYAAWPNDSNFNTVIDSASGFNISKNASGNFYANFVTGGGLTSASTYKDGVKRKFKLTFKAGVLQLYVNDVLTDTSTSVMTSVPFGVISLFYGTGGAATSGYYDDLIIHRN